MRSRALPLGIDIGSTRLRVVHAERDGSGARVRAVAVREVPDGTHSPSLADAGHLGMLIEDALAELRTPQRACVCSLGEPDAQLRTLTLPKMTGVERERAARFEAQRYVEYPIDEAVVRIQPIDARAGSWALGIARSCAIASRTAVLRAAGLRPLAIDHEACALARALPGYDAVADIGHDRTSLHVNGAAAPVTFQLSSGGAGLTRAIERELGVDRQTAEKRKRILGTAGAGERARADLISEVASLVREARARYDVETIALVGNAARLGGFAADLQAATGARCEVAVSDVLRSDRYPDDVARAGAPDWTLAAGLALWSVQ